LAATTTQLRRDIVVIGGSVGAVTVLLELAAALPPRFPAAILVVQHIGAHPSVLPELMHSRGPNRALHARNGDTPEPGSIHIAPPDHHLLLQRGAMLLTRDAKENHARPAIDPLFRSAAVAYGARVAGVILSGRLDDGTAGLQAVKLCGGAAVVQDPADAEEPGMPQSALDNVEVDHVVPGAQLAQALAGLVGTPVDAFARVPDPLLREFRISAGEGDPMEHLDAIGTPSKIVCPDCNGVLWAITGSRPARFRCHTGHAFTERSLAYAQGLATDQALWTAFRSLQERERLLRMMAAAGRKRGDEAAAARCEAEAEHVALHAMQLQGIVTGE